VAQLKREPGIISMALPESGKVKILLRQESWRAACALDFP
jgi:hypothetical protein